MKNSEKRDVGVFRVHPPTTNENMCFKTFPNFKSNRLLRNFFWYENNCPLFFFAVMTDSCFLKPHPMRWHVPLFVFDFNPCSGSYRRHCFLSFLWNAYERNTEVESANEDRNRPNRQSHQDKSRYLNCISCLEASKDEFITRQSKFEESLLC